MQQEQKIFKSLDSPLLSVGSLEDQANVTRRTYSCDKSNIRICNHVLEGHQSGPPVEIRHAVQSSIIAYTIFFVLILIAVMVALIINRQRSPKWFPVLRYVLIPFGIWLITSMSSLIFRWQSRKLLMAGYIDFYRSSSKVWKRSYVICSTAFAFGTTFFITSRESISPHIHVTGVNISMVDNVMFIFWCVVLLCLVWQYLCLLGDYVNHNQKRVLPDVANGCDYLPIPNNGYGEKKSNACNIVTQQHSSSLLNGEQATIKRQALTILYLEKQVKVLSGRLQTQQFKLPVSRSWDTSCMDIPSNCSMQEYQQLNMDRQLLESECKSFRFQVQSKEQDLLRLEHELSSAQGIRQRLEMELNEARDVLTAKQAKINDMHILLAVEREAADKARIFIEEISSQSNQGKKGR